jgi:anti-sigma B factor antagonist
MKIDVQESDKSIILQVHGDIEMVSIKQFREELFEIGEKTDKDIEIDLLDVDYIDSSGVGILISLLKLQNKKGKKLIVTKVSSKVHDVLKLSSLTDIFNL